MRFVYFFFMLMAVVNLIVVLLSGLTEVNIYKEYGKQILKGFCYFMLVLVAFCIALAFTGLGS